MKRHHLIKILYTAVAVILAGISAYDGIYRMESFKGIGALLEDAITGRDTGLLVLASFELVIIDTLWLIPGILSGFLLVDTWRHYLKGRWWLGYFLVIPWAFFIHLLLSLQGSNYSFVGTLTIALLGIIAVIEMGESRASFWPVILVAVNLTMAVNWLNTVPAVSFIPISYGDLDVGIKLAASFLGGEGVLNLVGLFFTVSFLFTSVISTSLTSVYLRRIALIEENQSKERQLQEMEMQARQARVLQEMHTLVHDLKTPLMTIRGLNSLVEMSASGDKMREYCSRIDGAVDKVNAMISEILYDEVRKNISVAELIQYVRAHVLSKNTGQQVSFDLEQELPLLNINVIRMSRVLINIIENAFTATTGVKAARITIKAYRNGDLVVFEILDNGKGIPEQNLDKVWGWGYSTKGNSAGLGLAFVRQIVENHGGTVDLARIPAGGTKVTIALKGVKPDEDTDN
ncbi:MAG TPA: HAMP domain-containing sensor histidine kinase [Bacillota bacterium]|nr:HAMP domain-containing sensor histidine kinase [Bacillota bacterium]